MVWRQLGAAIGFGHVVGVVIIDDLGGKGEGRPIRYVEGDDERGPAPPITGGEGDLDFDEAGQATRPDAMPHGRPPRALRDSGSRDR